MSESKVSSVAAEALLDGVWALDTNYLRRLWAAAERGIALPGALAAAAAPRHGTNGTAVIPIHGPISRRPDFFSLLFGIQSATTGGIANALRAAVADPGVGQIVLHVDSPGGETDGMTELASEIYEARGRKPITAFVDTTAASAAYWIASQADHIVVTPSGSVGSIGVFALHLDRSGELEDAGIVPTFIQAGKFKTEESPLHPLSDDAKASIQSRVDAFYSLFTKDVARGRGVPVETVRANFGEGRMVLAKDAVRRGMADVVSDRITARKASSTSATSSAFDDGLSIAAESAGSAFTYIATNAAGSNYAEQARQTFAWEVLSQGLRDREPSLILFREEDPRDRFFDRSSRRERSAIDVHGMAFPDRNGGRGEIWIRADLSPTRLVEVIEHEVRHVAQSATIHASKALAEADAHAYVTRDRMALIRELHGGGRRAS